MKLTTPLAKIYNDCISNAIFPGDWKITVLRVKHKKGDKSDMNYRCVSILPAIAKIFKRILVNKTRDLFNINKYFDSNKHMVLDEIINICQQNLDN